MENTRTTRTANRWERFVQFVEEETTTKGVLELLFVISVVWIFFGDPLNLEEVFGDFIIHAFAAVVVAGFFVLACAEATFLFLGSLCYFVAHRIIELRRKELRILYEMNNKALRSGVELKGKWKDLYYLMDYRGCKTFEDVKQTFPSGKRETVEYPITKWQIREDHEPPQWDLIEIPTDNHLSGLGAVCSVVLVFVIGILMSILGFVIQR